MDRVDGGGAGAGDRAAPDGAAPDRTPDLLAANRRNWDERVPIHVQSAFYDVEGWLYETARPPPA